MAVEHLTLTPSEYWQRQCHVGASFLRPAEAPLCEGVGIDNILTRIDYPHIEGSHPHTREHLRLTFFRNARRKRIKLLTTNVARVYGFDLEVLKPLPEKVLSYQRRSINLLFHILKFLKQQKGAQG